jgi:hypothetical protein
MIFKSNNKNSATFVTSHAMIISFSVQKIKVKYPSLAGN